MKKIFLLFSISLMLFACETSDVSSEPVDQEIYFSDYRQMETAIVVDDSVAKSTTITFSGSSLTFNWVAGYQSSILRHTRLLVAKPSIGITIIIVGFDDIVYSKLVILDNGRLSKVYDIGIVTIIKSKLDGNNLWFKYNNTWIRTAKLDDEEKIFKI